MVGLFDVNVLVALAWPNHVHHEAALKWFRRQSRQGWATCSITETGFVRVSSNRAILPEARSPQDAIALLRRITALPQHVFWTDDLRFAESSLVARSKIVGHRQVTDAHLLGLALRHRGRLVTFDAGIAMVMPEGRDPDDAICVIPAA
jgi:toxin-antitoxin system PIN domain toxin